MLKNIKMLMYFCVALLMVASLAACGGGGAGTVGSTTVGTTGTLSISMIDAPAPEFETVYVTINEIWVHEENDGWLQLTDLDLPQTFNLLELVGGTIAQLGAVELEAGHYNQMRLILSEDDSANYITFSEGEPINLKVPSGGETGIKLVSGFDIVASGSTELVLDFDALKSVIQAGNSGQWLLKPTIKVVESVTFSLEGTVTGGDADKVISAQIYDPDVLDPKDEIIAANTLSLDGYYLLYLPITERIFNIVATEAGYLPKCQVLDATEDGIQAYIMDFELETAAATGTLVGSLTGLAESADAADFSIRQEHDDCGMIEVAYASVAKTVAPDPVEYFEPITLPIGTYQVVVSGTDEQTQVWPIEVVADTETVLDVHFPTPSVYGIVYDETNLPLAGATISAQAYDDTALPEEKVAVITETSSDSNGAYYLDLPDDRPLNIVATMTGLEPRCQEIADLTSYFVDFALNAPAGGTGTISGTVPADSLTIATSALFSIRQTIDCGSGDTSIEVLSFSVDEGDTSAFFTLPVGTHDVVVSAESETTLQQPVSVSSVNTEVVFPAP